MLSGQNQERNAFQYFIPRKKREDSSRETFVGIEIDLFSYSIAPDNFLSTIQSVCGEHFDVQLQPEVSDKFTTIYIAPKEYCLVDGGMMYSSAGSIISNLVSKGFLIKGYWTILK